MKHYDFLIIGGGSAGHAAARTAAKHFKEVAIIEGAPRLGGQCILTGCMPSKTLIYSAEVLHNAKASDSLGLEIPAAKIDMTKLHARKNHFVDAFSDYKTESIENGDYDLIRDYATFVDPHTVQLKDTDEQVSADYFLIATGSVVNTPDIPGLRETPHWTSDDVLDLDFIPESVIVLGGGIVACELAQFLSRSGSKVTQIQRSARILSESSAASAKVIEQAFRDESITLHTDTKIESISCENGEYIVKYLHQGRPTEARAAHLFNALGRKPATKGIGIEQANLELEDSGHIRINEMRQTSQSHIYSAGDVSGPYEIVHTAILEGETAVRHAAQQNPSPIAYDLRTGVVFTDPQIGTAGISEDEAGQRGLSIITASYPFNDHGKSMIMDANYGYVKIWADSVSHRILGAEAVGKDAGELIHTLAIAITLKATPSDLLQVQWYHPTLSEIWSYPIEELVEKLSQSEEKHL